MLREDKTLKLIEIFIVCDDFCNALADWQTRQGCLPTTRQGEMSDSEMLTLVVFYHFSGYNRVDFYGLNNRRGIKFVIFFTPINDSVYSVN